MRSEVCGGFGAEAIPVGAGGDAPNVVWAIDFPFDSTVDGKAIEIASMIDEHTLESRLNLVERSITGEALVEELTRVFATNGGSPTVLRMDNGPEMVSQALQLFCESKTGTVYIPPGCPWDNGYIESFNSRLRKECLNHNHWNTLFEARVVIGDFKATTTTDTATRPWATAHRPSEVPQVLFLPGCEGRGWLARGV